MAFQQLYYTSCEHGLLGYGGFQFNAATPGVSPVVMREAEDRTSYEPPRSMPGDPKPDQLAGYPVAFSHSLASGGVTITARVVFAGNDYSGRPGNYFAHVLVNQSAADFGSLLPAELWDAPLWRTTPVDERELPLLPGPPPPGPVDRAGVQAFLQSADPRVLPVLLTAVGRSMAGDRSVLLAGPDCATNAVWIAAVSYLLGEALARRMSFTTYSHRPAYSQHHLVGVLAGSETIPADQSFHVYDASTGRLPDLPVHPLAALLARAGVLRADALWRQALALASGTAADFPSWHPAVSAAAALTGEPLDRGDVTAALSWLGSAQRGQPEAGPVLLALLDRHDEPFSDEQLHHLHALALRLRLQAAAEKLEFLLVDQAYARLGRGEPPGPAIRLSSRAVEAQAHARCVEALDSLRPEQVPDLLEWTADAGVDLDPGEFREYGLFLSPALGSGLLAAILDGRPDILAGLVTRLSQHPGEARDLFARADVIGLDDLTGQPALAELWLLAARARGELSAMNAFQNIGKNRWLTAPSTLSCSTRSGRTNAPPTTCARCFRC
jgi:GTPase-associated protein 1, N-terminal domain type 2/GTPase-associated protein 1, middle domain